MGDLIRGFISECLAYWLSPVKSKDQRTFEYYANETARHLKKLKGK